MVIRCFGETASRSESGAILAFHLPIHKAGASWSSSLIRECPQNASVLKLAGELIIVGKMGRGGALFTRDDFFPDASFQSFRAYCDAVRQTPERFKERLFTRADAGEEVSRIRARSKHSMKRMLTWWDLGWFAIGAVIGAGVFVLTGVEARDDAGPAVVLSYVAAGFSAMLAVFCYTEFAVEIPVAGGSFAYLRVELGEFVAFIAAGNIFLEGLIGSAALGRSWTSYFATLLNYDPDDFRIHTNLPDSFNLLDPIAVVIMLIIGAIATVSTKAASTLNWIASAITMLIIAFIIIAGLANADAANYTPFMPYGVRGVFKAAAVLFFAYLGFDTVATMAEETKDPKRDIPIGLLVSMSVVTVLYCLMAVTLCLLESYLAIDVNAPFSSAFRDVAGWNWAQYVVALGALKSMTTVLLVNTVGQARYLTHIARTHIIPPWFGLVNEKTGTPINATVVAISSSAIIAFFTSLSVLANLLSISTLFIFMLVAVSLLVRRYYVKGETSRHHQRLLVIFLLLIVASSAVTAIYWANSEGWIAYAVTIPVWFVATLGLAIFVPKARKPSFWGVPLVPWLPSLSILANVFLLGSLDGASFIRFVVWTGILLLYYVFWGLHASYDAAHSLTISEEGKRGGGEFSRLEEQQGEGVEQQDAIASSMPAAKQPHLEGEAQDDTQYLLHDAN